MPETARPHVLVPLLLLLLPAVARAQGEEGMQPAKIGSLHRAAATLDSVLDVYRLALVELVPAARRIREAGQPRPDAASNELRVPPPLTLVPAPASEVFTRLAASLAARVPSEALPVIPRGYHAEVIDALEQLGLATTLPEVVEPLSTLARAMARVCDSGDAIVDLFSRARPIQMRIVDGAVLLDEVSEALDEVAAAERSILTARNRRAPLGEQLQAFLRLEVSLGHALDLIAGAEEAGLLIGFEAQLSTSAFAERLARVRAQLVELDRALAEIRRPPAAITGELVADLVEQGRAGESRLRWRPPFGTPPAAAVRIFRRPSLPGMRQRLAAAFRCEGKGDEEAAELAEAALAEVDASWVQVSEEAPGIGSFTEAFTELPMAPPAYRVVAVSPFGIEGVALESTARLVPAALEGPSEIRARSLAPAAGDPAFYTDLDRVEVRWQLSPSDLEDRGGLAAETPLVQSYRVLRQSVRGVERVAEVGPGTASIIDRVPPALLASGVRYSVEATNRRFGLAGPPSGCGAGEVLARDLSSELRLSRLGLAQVRHPTQIARLARDRFADPLQLAAARDAFARRPAAEQAELLNAWWQQVPRAQRLQRLAAWPTLLADGQRASWLAEAADHLSAADLPLAQAEVWLASQPPEVQEEIDRWWELLDQSARAQATAELRAWFAGSGERWISEQLGAGSEQALRPAKVLAWLRSRDPQDLTRLEGWWQELDADARLHATRVWLTVQPHELQLALRWPTWERLTEAEREQRLATPPGELPEELWREALAWLAWHEVVQAGGEQLEQTIAAETSAAGRLLRRLRWALRPLDVRLGFSLPWVALGVLVGTPAIVVLLRRRLRRLG